MPKWKCVICGYSFEADTPPDECPSCKQKCEFVDNSCYTPDCAGKGTDDRIGQTDRITSGSALNDLAEKFTRQ